MALKRIRPTASAERRGIAAEIIRREKSHTKTSAGSTTCGRAAKSSPRWSSFRKDLKDIEDDEKTLLSGAGSIAKGIAGPWLRTDRRCTAT
jgi:hypothetical protein